MRIAFQKYELDNGLTVIVHEDHATPKAAVNLLYKVGAKDETEERTGLAHLFEHLMFSGSKNIPNYDNYIQTCGGECNAFTNNDITNYYLSLPSNQLEMAFWLESDRMLELDFSQKNLDVQKSVVCEEFKQRYLNQPYGDAYSLMRQLVYKKHPYKWMTIGKDLSHIEEVTLDVIKDFFYRFYAPNNCILSVAGDVNPDEVLRLAKKWFGPIPFRDIRRNPITQEPAQTEARFNSVSREVPHTAVYTAYQIPGRESEGYYAADMISDLLSNGKSTRLYQALVKEKKVATNINAFTWGLQHTGMLSVDGQVAVGRTAEEYVAALDEALEDLINFSSAELERMKNKVESQEAFGKTKLTDLALGLAMYENLGDLDLINTLGDKYRSLTEDQIREAIKTYIRPENRSTLHYLAA